MATVEKPTIGRQDPTVADADNKMATSMVTEHLADIMSKEAPSLGSPRANPDSKLDRPVVVKSLRRVSQHPTLTPYRRRVYRTLLSVPPGRWTTYAALSAYLGSSARAVGNAMRTNPFAPDVPCHRVLAADRTLGGYKGEWKGEKRGKEKRSLLENEGVAFDELGRAQGECFHDFVELTQNKS